tara:strand:+ start:749 stop:1120 length:372 start_codon:yes stop_codon:yes gene_type:complete
MNDGVTAIFVLIIIFGAIFGTFYLYFSTRNKERLALIEKGADATIFMKGRSDNKPAPFWKVFVLNLSVLLMGIGLGTLIAMILSSTLALNYEDAEAIYPGVIFLTAGAGLFVGFNLTKKLDKE